LFPVLQAVFHFLKPESLKIISLKLNLKSYLSSIKNIDVAWIYRNQAFPEMPGISKIACLFAEKYFFWYLIHNNHIPGKGTHSGKRDTSTFQQKSSFYTRIISSIPETFKRGLYF
jgi:hypothetical protein